MDKAERLARDLLANTAMVSERGIADVAKAISAYGEQCRRAGAEAMREASAERSRWRVPRVRFIDGEQIAQAIRSLPLPSAAEAASPEAGCPATP